MGKLCFAVGLTGVLRVFGYMTEPLLDRHEIHAVTGEPTRVVNMVPPVDELKIVTWNIERGNAYASILSTLRRLNPDILLLQEVDRDCRRTGYRDVARDLAHELGMNWVSGGEFQEIGEARGKKPAITGQATGLLLSGLAVAAIFLLGSDTMAAPMVPVRLPSPVWNRPWPNSGFRNIGRGTKGG